ncbi:aldo/keto reductase [Metapseudomonas boanensis]|uniref:Aldo/keto reductase n=1 Tax=Metapseudomonas boanensis TaxID=2822138 RepID=A0ABS5XGH9_9GAMM|nr:aldo/keto reductase [Pseudomonas boanensis]MBT8766794.1 aldo/keto reductase [Pseudomonas boanensis]
MRQIEFPDGAEVPVIGQGTWHMGESRSERKREVAALREGVALGLRLIDTAEMYAEGGAEEVVGEAIAGVRDDVFLVSKVYPWNASRKGIPLACERSLKRLGTDRLDLYLLHWRGEHPLDETVEAFERLREQGKIARWGVSNLDLDDLLELPSGCAANQVLYNPAARGIEFDLLPWQRRRGMPLMAYCPVGRGGKLLDNGALRQVAERHAATSAQVALAWALRQENVLVIPKAVDPLHLKQNAEAHRIALTAEDLALIDRHFPPPARERPLEMI